MATSNNIVKLCDLPKPQENIKGWPWIEASESLSFKMQDTSSWPRISIVTPSYNQGKFIEETIRSVLLQNYPNIEYIVIDGGSTDETVSIIEKYAPWITYWVSEKDNGQSHAINKGFKRATGEIYYWLNSDDYLLPGALISFAKEYVKDDKYIAWVGTGVKVDSDRNELGLIPAAINGDINFLADWWRSSYICQPACFFSEKIFSTVGGLDESLHYAMDFDLWLKLRKHGEFMTLNFKVACARLYAEIKTYKFSELSHSEVIYICIKNGAYEAAGNRIKLIEKTAISNILISNRSSSFGLIYEVFRRFLLNFKIKI